VSSAPRFWQVGLVVPDIEAAAEELERALTALGLDGAMIFGRTGPQHLDHADLWPVYEVAERRSAPLHLHPQSPAPAVRNAYYSGFGPAVEAAFATFGVGWHYDAAWNSSGW